MARKLLLVLLCSAALICCATANATETVQFGATKDATLVESTTGHLANGFSPGLFCGRTNQPAGIDIRRALIEFDVAANVPAGATIESVKVRLRLTKTVVGNQFCTLHRVQTQWSEGPSSSSGVGAPSQPTDVTWIHTSFPSAFWTNAGGDFDASPMTTANVSIGPEVVWDTTPELVAAVQDWLDNPGSNFGLMVRGNEDTDISAKRFGSKDSVFTMDRPWIMVEYTSPDSCLSDVTDAKSGPPDGTVDVFDLLALLMNWNTNGVGADIAPPNDVVNVFDLLDLIAAWGDC